MVKYNVPHYNVSNKNVGVWVSTDYWKSAAANMNRVHSGSSWLEPSALYRSVLLIMDRAPENEVPQALQVVHNETIAVLLNLQALNCMTEMYSVLYVLLPCSQISKSTCTWKGPYNVFESDTHCCYSTWFIAVICKGKETRNGDWPQKYPSWFVYKPCTSLVITKFHRQRNKNTSNGFCYLKEPNLLGLSDWVGCPSL